MSPAAISDFQRNCATVNRFHGQSAVIDVLGCSARQLEQWTQTGTLPIDACERIAAIAGQIAAQR